MTQQLVRDQIAEMITAGMTAAQEAGALPEFALPAITVERSRQTGHGDYASPTCLQLARLARMSPRDIATRVVERLQKRPPLDAASVARLLARVEARRAAVGFTMPYRAWLEHVTPPDLA